MLYKYEVSSCSSEFIGSSTAYLTDIALTPSGELYGIDFYNFYKIDKNNASTTFISSIDQIGAGFNSLMGYNDEYLLGLRIGGSLYKIHSLNGDTTFIHSLGYSPAGDLTYYKGWYYYSDATNQLIRFKLDFENSLVSDISVVGTMNTSSNAVFGILTMGDPECEKSDLKMIAFEGLSIYEVDPYTANCLLLCSDAPPVFGAASNIETLQPFLESEIELPNVFTPNYDGVNDIFEPVILNGVLNLEITVINRWGNIVYEDNKIEWNGLSTKNEMCTEGVYFYKVVYSDFCNKNTMVTGFIQLEK